MNLKINKEVVEKLDLLYFFNSKYIREHFNLNIKKDKFYEITFLDKNNKPLTDKVLFKTKMRFINYMKQYMIKNVSINLKPCEETYEIATRISEDMKEEGYYMNKSGMWDQEKVPGIPIAREIPTKEDIERCKIFIN